MEPRIQDFDPRGFWLGRGLFWAKHAPEKRWFCRGKGSPWGLRGFCKTEMDCMVSRTFLGRPISPQTLPEHIFSHFPRFREKLGGPPGPPWWIPIGPLWRWQGPMGCLPDLFPLCGSPYSLLTSDTPAWQAVTGTGQHSRLTGRY